MGRVGLGLLAGAVTAALFLTDWAAQLVGGVERLRWLTLGVDPELAGHVLAWGAFAAAAVLALGRELRLLAPVMWALFSLGVAVEQAQPRLTTMRGFELEDVVANGVGVAVGAAAVLAATALRDRSRTPPRPAPPPSPAR